MSGLWIAIISMMLAVPLSIVANLLTPKIVRWWSTTSKHRREKRILFLEKRKQQLASEWKYSPGEWGLQKLLVDFGTFAAFALQLFVCLIVFSVGALWGVAETIVGHTVKVTGAAGHRLWLVLLLICLLMPTAILFIIYAMEKHRRSAALHNPDAEQLVDKEIAKLKRMDQADA